MTTFLPATEPPNESSPRGVLASDVVVAARERRPQPASGRRAGGSWLPVGVRHGVLSTHDPEVTTRQALCGAPLTGWFVFLAEAFTGAAPADCRRCEQVMRSRRAARVIRPRAGERSSDSAPPPPAT